MEKTYSSELLERFAYHPLPDGTAIVYLRENIEKDVVDNIDGDGCEFWTADEVMVKTSLPPEKIEENFDALWARAETDGKSVEERLANVEEMLDATMAVVLGTE